MVHAEICAHGARTRMCMGSAGPQLTPVTAQGAEGPGHTELLCLVQNQWEGRAGGDPGCERTTGPGGACRMDLPTHGAHRPAPTAHVLPSGSPSAIQCHLLLTEDPVGIRHCSQDEPRGSLGTVHISGLSSLLPFDEFEGLSPPFGLLGPPSCQDQPGQGQQRFIPCRLLPRN